MYGDAGADGAQGEGAEAAAPEARAYADDGGVTVIVEDIREEDEGTAPVPGARGSPAETTEAEKEKEAGKKRRGAGGAAQKKRAKARPGGRREGAKAGGAGKRKRQGKKKHRAK